MDIQENTTIAPEDLIAEAGENRIERKYVDARQALALILGILLDGFDYEAEIRSEKAVFARMIASVIASIDDNPQCMH